MTFRIKAVMNGNEVEIPVYLAAGNAITFDMTQWAEDLGQKMQPMLGVCGHGEIKSLAYSDGTIGGYVCRMCGDERVRQEDFQR